MKCAPFTLNQPENIYMLFKHITWVYDDRVFDGNVLNSGAVLNRSTTPQLSLYAGGFVLNNGNLALDTWGIMRVKFNGNGSSIQINETAAITGDAGATGMGGFKLGTNGQEDVFSHIEVKEIVIRKIDDTANDSDLIYNYLKDKYNL
jgi:hypothetical protein